MVSDAWPGALWRGVFGRALKERSEQGTEACDVYRSVFEGCEPGRQLQIPGFTLTASPSRDRRATRIQLTLFGEAVQSLSVATAALIDAAGRGVGKTRVPLALHKVDLMDWRTTSWRALAARDRGLHVSANLFDHVPTAPCRVAVTLTSPLRLVRHGNILRPQEVDADAVARCVLGRFERLLTGQCHTPNGLLQSAGSLTELAMSNASLTWTTATRFSARQQKALNLAGVTGSFALSGPALTTLWPWLWAGQHTHIGKGTTSGLGGYRLTNPDFF